MTGSSAWAVTSTRVVHLRGGSCTTRIRQSTSWLPSMATPKDRACKSCLGGFLPDAAAETRLRARLAASKVVTA